MTTQPAVYETRPVVTTTTGTPATYALTRPIAPSSTSSSSRRWGRCALWLHTAGRWCIRRRYELAPLAATTALTILGVAQHGAGPATVYGALAATAAAAGAAGLKYKNPPITYIGAAGFVALADITTAAAAGPAWPTLTAWALTTAGAYAAYVPWLIRRRHDRMKLQLDTVKAKAAVPDALGMEAADPGLTGSTPEETALRRALHALTGHAPARVDAFHYTQTGGWSCIISMPPGRNTAPSMVVKRQGQLEANLGMPGKLTLTEGPGPDQLVVKLNPSDLLAGTIPFVDSGDRTCTTPVLLGADEDGREMRLTVLYRHTLIAGASDWGKSGIANLLISRLAVCDDARLFGIDMKPGAPELGPWSTVMQVAKTAAQAADLLDWIRAECDRRGAILEQLSHKAMADGDGPVRKWTAAHGRFLFVITDELAELVRQDDALAKKYESLLAIARSVGIQFISATQQPSRKVFGGSTDARGNYANRLSTRQGESGHAAFIFGAGCQSAGWTPQALDLPGKFLAQTPEHDEPRRVYRAQYVTDRDIAAAVQFHYSDVRDTEEQPALTDEPWVRAFAPATFPDGTPVGDAWPDLWHQFERLGTATKKELAQACHISRDTAMRAIEHWCKHGVQQQRDGRSTRYYLPETQ